MSNPGSDETIASTVSILSEIPEGLHDRLLLYLEQRPHLDMDKAIVLAISLLLSEGGWE